MTSLHLREPPTGTIVPKVGTLAVLIPAYNEARNITAAVWSCYQAGLSGADSVDGRGLAWNRHIENGLGIRFTQSVKTGMVRAGLAYLVDHRFPIQQTAVNRVSLFVEAWFGWHQAAPPYIPPSPYLGGK